MVGPVQLVCLLRKEYIQTVRTPCGYCDYKVIAASEESGYCDYKVIAASEEVKL